ncbi:MAG: cytochrome c oxidase subunit II transmembrane domain-containing protein [Pseudomonadota bacterium]
MGFRDEFGRKSAAVAAGAAALAGAMIGTAVAQTPDNGISLLEAKSPLAEEVHFFHNWVLMPVMVGISLLVLALLIWVVIRYNAKANPTAKTFSHNTTVEIVWTGGPILILLFIALFSFDLLYKEDVVPDGKRFVFEGDGAQAAFVMANDFAPRRRLVRRDHIEARVVGREGARDLAYGEDYTLAGLGDDAVTIELKAPPAIDEALVVTGGRSRVGPGKVFGLFGEDRSEIALAPTVTVKVLGFQWGWTYSYPDYGDFEVTSLMADEDKTSPETYKLAVDNPIYIPAGETIRVVTSASDVIHSWALPNFALKIDAVPGRLNEAWFSAPEEGVYYGQCSEICGVKHAFMPIEIRAVNRQDFIKWVNEQREANGMEPVPAPQATAQALPTGAARVAAAD